MSRNWWKPWGSLRKYVHVVFTDVHVVFTACSAAPTQQKSINAASSYTALYRFDKRLGRDLHSITFNAINPQTKPMEAWSTVPTIIMFGFSPAIWFLVWFYLNLKNVQFRPKHRSNVQICRRSLLPDLSILERLSIQSVWQTVRPHFQLNETCWPRRKSDYLLSIISCVWRSGSAEHHC